MGTGTLVSIFILKSGPVFKSISILRLIGIYIIFSKTYKTITNRRISYGSLWNHHEFPDTSDSEVSLNVCHLSWLHTLFRQTHGWGSKEIFAHRTVVKRRPDEHEAMPDCVCKRDDAVHFEKYNPHDIDKASLGNFIDTRVLRLEKREE